MFTVSSTLMWAVLTGPTDWVCHTGTLTLCVDAVELYYCNMVEWFWWDSSMISTTNWFPSVLWHCWFGHLSCKNCSRNDLLCVECDVKPYTLTHLLSECEENDPGWKNYLEHWLIRRILECLWWKVVPDIQKFGDYLIMLLMLITDGCYCTGWAPTRTLKDVIWGLNSLFSVRTLLCTFLAHEC